MNLFRQLVIVSFVIGLPYLAQAQAVGFENPLGNDVLELKDFLANIISYILGLVGLLALLALVVGGGRLIIGFGNEQQVKSAKEIIKWAIIGLIVVTLSYVIIRLVAVDFLGVRDAS